MLDRVREKRNEVYKIAKENHAERLWVFGSCARKEEREGSDIDFLVKWKPGCRSWLKECRMSEAYERMFGCKVDLVSSSVLPMSLGFAYRVCAEAVPV